jgi:hypothetical protein
MLVTWWATGFLSPKVAHVVRNVCSEDLVQAIELARVDQIAMLIDETGYGLAVLSVHRLAL